MISPDTAPNPAPRSSQDHSRLYGRLSHLRETQTLHPAHPRRSHRFKLLLRAAGSLLLLLIVCVVAFTLSLRHAMRAALPQLDGNIHVPGLSAPVTVTRDPQGVPSITAANLDDLLFTQGYVTASDRLFQMDALRRHAAGTLAEILGPSLVPHDRFQRTLQIRAAADRALTTLPPDQLHQLSTYAAGVNAFISSHTSSLPVEFHLLRYTPAPWTPRDTLLVVLAMAQDLSTEFPQKLNRESLSTRLPANLLPDLYPSGSWRDIPPGQPSNDLTAPKDVLQIPLDRSQSRLIPPAALPSATPANLLSAFAALNHTACDNCRSGSNNWAVNASHSAAGAPLLSNDMHLGLIVPSTWYEAALHTNVTGPNTAPLDVTGFTLPGVPFVIVGRNAHVAWGFTAALADVQDIRIEHLRSSGPNGDPDRNKDQQFELPDGSWAPVHHHPETIHVRFGLDKTIDVLTTTHTVGSTSIETPLLTPIYPTDHRALSLAWNVYDPATIAVPGLAIDAATNGASLVAAFATFGTPSLNLVYADDANHIGYHLLGRIPIRGPATQRPRATPQFILPDVNPDDDQDEQGSSADADSPADAPKAALTPPFAAPHLELAAYARPHRRARSEQHAPRILKAQHKPKVPPARHIEPTPSPDQQTIAPAPATAYTIGSPISPIPVDSLDASQVWSGFIPYAELPSTIDPDSGILATANARITTDNFPYFIANDWADPYRLERIHHQLSGRTHLTPADLLALQNDVHSDLDLLVAQRVAYAIDHTSQKSDTKRLHQAADLLRAWDGNLTPNSTAAAIATSTRAELWPILLTAQLKKSCHPAPHEPQSACDPARLIPLYTWNERTFALEQLLEHTPARWLPSNFHSWDELLAFALQQGLQHAHAPSDLTRFTYGSIHPVEIAHPIFGSHTFLSQMLGLPTGTGYHPNGGDGTTVKQTGLHFGPSERFTADLSNTEATLGNITTGQSGNPASPWYLDQFLPWLNGTTFSLPLHYPRSTHTLTLNP